MKNHHYYLLPVYLENMRPFVVDYVDFCKKITKNDVCFKYFDYLCSRKP